MGLSMMERWSWTVISALVTTMFRTVSGSLMISASPSTTVSTGSPVQVICHVHTEFTPDMGQCTISWSRNYYPGREYEEETLSGKVLDQPRFYTTTDSAGRPLSSSVHIPHMRDVFRGTYMCRLSCTGYQDTVSIVINTVTVPVTFGATIGTLVAFLVVSIVLLLAFFVVCRRCCCRPSRSHVHLSSESSVGLFAEAQRRESEMAPPRYSVVVSLPRDGSGTGSALREESINTLLVHQPPSYADALKDLQAKGIVINCNKLKPMPPAYSDIPFTLVPSEAPAILQLTDVPTGGSPA